MPPHGSDFHPPAAEETAGPPDLAAPPDRVGAVGSIVDGKTSVEAKATRGLAKLAGLIAAVIALAVVYFLIR